MKDTTELLLELEQAKSTIEFQEFLKQNKATLRRETFGDYVLKLCAKYEIKASLLQPQIAMSKAQFYNLLNGTRHPSKESVLKMAFGLQATCEEADELLRIAGFQILDPKKKEDAILIFGLEQKKEPGKIDELLREYGCKIRLVDET